MYLTDEVKVWNTPLVGAYLLWKFTKGYCAGHPTGDAPVGLLHFIAMAMLTNEKLLEPISNRRDNLQSYIKSFEQAKNSDVLLSISDVIQEKRGYTMAAIDIAITQGLLVWDINSGKLHARELEKRPGRGKNLKRLMETDGQKAEILGKWFAQHDCSAIAAYLKVVL